MKKYNNCTPEGKCANRPNMCSYRPDTGMQKYIDDCPYMDDKLATCHNIQAKEEATNAQR